MDCQCPIWTYGRTRDVLVPRQSTGTRDLAVAEAQRQSLLKQGQDAVARGPRIDDCVERFLESHQSKLAEGRFPLQRSAFYRGNSAETIQRRNGLGPTIGRRDVTGPSDQSLSGRWLVEAPVRLRSQAGLRCLVDLGRADRYSTEWGLDRGFSPLFYGPTKWAQGRFIEQARTGDAAAYNEHGAIAVFGRWKSFHRFFQYSAVVLEHILQCIRRRTRTGIQSIETS